MKKLLKLMAIAFIIISVFSLTGCKDKYSVYVFTSSGGYVTINDSTDKISLKEILYYSKEVDLTLNAHEDEGYQFLYWLVDSKVHSTEKSISLNIKKETVIKAMYEKSDSLTITFVDENNNLITETPLSINHNETMQGFPEIPARDGYVAHFYCGEDIMLEGKPYPYTTSKTFVLKYTQEKYNVTVKYVDCTQSDLSLNLVQNNSWSVLYGESVHFTLTSQNKEFNLFVNNVNNPLYANAYGVYTIKDITEDTTLIVKFKSVITNPDDSEEDDEENDTNDENNDNLDSSLAQVSIKFDENNMPSTAKIIVELDEDDYDYKYNKYYVYKNADFSFSVDDKSIFKPDNRKVYANGEEVPFKNGEYTLNNIKENVIITIDYYYTMYMSIDYGMIATNYYEDLIDADYVPFYDACITFKHTRISNYTGTLNPDEDKITFFVNKTTKTMTITEFVDYINNTIDVTPNHKITSIDLTNSSGSVIANNWAKITYDKNYNAEVETQEKSFFHQSTYIIRLNWEEIG